MTARSIGFTDTHTAGEPTRVVFADADGLPDLGNGTLSERVDRWRREHDQWRSAIVNEPRGSDVMVGALVCEPHDPSCDAGVIFINNVGYLGMCGHGTIGVIVALAHRGVLQPGPCNLETPVGVVAVELAEDRRTVSLDNVPARRTQAGVNVTVPGLGTVTGDVAWGGNWFFLTEDHGLGLAATSAADLTAATLRIRDQLASDGITGDDGALIDHVELFGPPTTDAADSRNFVLCPGGAWDRSPCGTGTSAKLACLVAAGKLDIGAVWRQEGFVGGIFEAVARDMLPDGSIRPHIRGSAFVTGEGHLLLDPDDPFCFGIRT